MSEGVRSIPFSNLVHPAPRTFLPRSTECSFVGMEDISESGYVIRQRRWNTDSSAGYTVFQDRDVLFAKITPCMENGKGALVSGLSAGVGVGSTEFHVLRAREGVDPRFVAQWTRMRDFRLSAEAMMTGSAGQRRVPRSFFCAYKVPTLSLPEQRRIAEILDTVDENIRSTERLIVKLEQTKQGLICELLDRSREESMMSIKDALISAVDGPFGSRLKSEHYVGTDGVRVVRLQNIKSGRFDASDLAMVSQRYASELRAHEVVPGDLLVASLGDESYPFGRACIYPHSEQYGIVKADCFRLRLDLRMVEHRYVMHMLNSPIYRNPLNGLAQGVTRDRVNLSNLAMFKFPCPSPKEQNYVCDTLDRAIDRVESKQHELAKLRKLKQGLMDDLLTGKVRVNGDETA